MAGEMTALLSRAEELIAQQQRDPMEALQEIVRETPSPILPLYRAALLGRNEQLRIAALRTWPLDQLRGSEGWDLIGLAAGEIKLYWGPGCRYLALLQMAKIAPQRTPDLLTATQVQALAELANPLEDGVAACLLRESLAAHDPTGEEWTASALLARAKSRETLQAYEEAYHWALLAAVMEPLMGEAYEQAGRSLVQLGRCEEALRLLEQAVELHPSSGDTYFELGSVLYRLERYADAAVAYSRSLARYPDSIAPRYNRGLCYCRLRRWQQAIDDFTWALEHGAWGKDAADCHYSRGIAHKETGDRERAAADYRRAMELVPGYTAARDALRNLQPDSRDGDWRSDFDASQLVEWPKTTFGDVVGLEQIKSLLRGRVITALARPDLAGLLGVDPSCGLFLYGPPGCGKSLIVEALAGEMGAPLIRCRISAILSMWAGNSEKAIQGVFAHARELVTAGQQRAVIVFFDELDALGGQRAAAGPGESWVRLVVNTLLMESQRAGRGDGIVLVGASNFPDLVDPALLRPERFGDVTLFVPSPEVEQRQELFRFYLTRGRAPEAVGPVDYRALAERTEGFSPSAIAEVVQQAATRALQQSAEAGRLAAISQALLLEVLAETPPDKLRWQELSVQYRRFGAGGPQRTGFNPPQQGHR